MNNRACPTTTRYRQTTIAALAGGLLLELLGKAYAKYYEAGRDIAERIQFGGYILIFISGLYAILFISLRISSLRGEKRSRELVGLPLVFLLAWLAFWIYLMPDLISFLTPGK
ncbi:MAG: hypothetical protein IPL70_06740 [Uliginosibacterium sp.]|nr:hypothetical protein [Uliginosibacterium sp.]